MHRLAHVRSRSGARLIGTVAAAALVLGLAACGSDSSTSDSAEATTGSTSSSEVDTSGVTLRVATYPASSGGGDQALLEAAGLDDTPYDIEFQTYPDGGTQTGAVNQGTADLARGSSVAGALLAGSDEKQNFLSVATLKIPTVTQWTVAKDDITSLEELKGKKVAFTANTTSQYFLLRQLDSVGLTMDDIEAVPLAPANALAALIGGSVDAMAGSGGPVQTAVAQGFPMLADGGPILKGSLGGLAGAYNAYAPDLDDPAKAAAIADYVGRVNAAMAWTRAHADEWNERIATSTNQDVAAVAANFRLGENDTNSSVGPVAPEAIADQQEIAETFRAAGVITKDVDVAATFSDQLNDQIAAAVAKYKAENSDDFAVTTVD
jgi:sulfonate transport system substrate-binding protein